MKDFGLRPKVFPLGIKGKMKKIKQKSKREKRKLRIRKNIFGTKDRPRFSVYRSNKFIYGQLIDDTTGVTLVAAKGLKNIKSARKVGVSLAKKAIAKKIKNVVFDRNGYKYHGRVKTIADGAREGGLNF